MIEIIVFFEVFVLNKTIDELMTQMIESFADDCMSSGSQTQHNNTGIEAILISSQWI
jgi:hypothetical protein